MRGGPPLGTISMDVSKKALSEIKLPICGILANSPGLITKVEDSQETSNTISLELDEVQEHVAS